VDIIGFPCLPSFRDPVTRPPAVLPCVKNKKIIFLCCPLCQFRPYLSMKTAPRPLAVFSTDNVTLKCLKISSLMRSFPPFSLTHPHSPIVCFVIFQVCLQDLSFKLFSEVYRLCNGYFPLFPPRPCFLLSPSILRTCMIFLPIWGGGLVVGGFLGFGV